MNFEPETYEELIRMKRCIELTKYYALTEAQLEDIYVFLMQNPDGSVGIVYTMNKTIEELLADGSILVQGTDVADARAASIRDQQMGNVEYIVDLTMTEEGTEKFAEATRNAYTKGETLGIYYDGSIVSAPTVQAILTDGKAQISNQKSFEEAESLASTIRIGGLKLELTDDALTFIVDNAYDPVYGARPLKRYIQKHVETLTAKLILEGKANPNDLIRIGVRDGVLSAEISDRQNNG